MFSLFYGGWGKVFVSFFEYGDSDWKFYRNFAEQFPQSLMFPIVIRSKHFPFRPFGGITLFCFIIFRSDMFVRASDMRHEMTHVRQQMEWLVVGFVILYFGEFLFNYLRYRDFMEAYYHISFEREAYAHEHEPDYLKRRKLWANYRSARKSKLRT